LKRNRETDKSEFMSCKNVFEIKKNLSKRELIDKEEIKKLLKLLPMRTKTLQNLR